VSIRNPAILDFSLETHFTPKNRANARVVGTKNRKIAKNFYSLSTNELRESSIENRGLFSAQMRKFAQL